MIDKAKLVADQQEVWRREQEAFSIHRQLVQISIDSERQAADPEAQKALVVQYAEIRTQAAAVGLL